MLILQPIDHDDHQDQRLVLAKELCNDTQRALTNQIS
jgi:hypothetical protein